MVHRGHLGGIGRCRRFGRWPLALAGVTALGAGLGGCASTPVTVANWQTDVSAEPQFPESQWKVKASPRVASAEAASPSYKIGKPYQVGEKWYHPREQPDYDRIGIASWYGANFHGRKTANGEIYDMRKLTAAHPTLPMPSYVYVTNVQNNRTVLVRINDRGPYVKDRMIDLSKAAADALQLSGIAKVRVRFAGPAPLDGNDRRERHFLATGEDIGAPGGFGMAGQPQVATAAAPSTAYSPAAYPPPTPGAPQANGTGAGGGPRLTWQTSPFGHGTPQMPPPAEGEPMWMPEQQAPPTTSALQYGAEPAPQAPQAGGYSGWDAASYRAHLSGR